MVSSQSDGAPYNFLFDIANSDILRKAASAILLSKCLSLLSPNLFYSIYSIHISNYLLLTVFLIFIYTCY